MAAQDRLEAALNEARMMILGGQVVLGFQFNAIFQSKFSGLAPHLKWMNGAAVGLLIAALTLLLAPAPFHRIAERGNATARVRSFTTAMIALCPLPFAAAIGMDVMIVNDSIAGAIAAAALSFVALLLWYGVEFMKRAPPQSPAVPDTKTSTREKIKTINTEARMILPGVQALLGFQFSAYLMQGFDRLPPFAKTVHFAGLVGLGLAAIFLMAPAAYHRIAAHGDNRPDVETFAVWMVLGSLVPLTVGLCGDLYLVLGIVSDWASWVAWTAIAAGFGMWCLWFGVPLLAAKRTSPLSTEGETA